MENFTFAFHTRIEFGAGVLNKTGDIAREFGAQKAIIVTDRGVKETPVYARVSRLLQEAGLEQVLYEDVRPNPRDVDADEAGGFARKENADLVIGLGGGSSLDMAKAVAAMLTNEGPVAAVMKPNKLKRDAAPLICIPTTAGTGSEVTSFAVLTLEKEKRKSSIFDDRVRPLVAIDDPEVLRDIPAPIAAATGIDALTHAIEAYTCRLATPITDALALHAIRCIARGLRGMVHERQEQHCRDMMMGSLLAGIAFGFSDIAGVHCMAEALGGLYDTPHGVANSIFLPIVFEYNIPADVYKHKEVGLALGIDPVGKSDRETAQAAAEYLRLLSADVGIPGLSKLGYVDPKDFDFLADSCMKNVSLPSNARKLTKDDFLTLYRRAWGG